MNPRGVAVDNHGFIIVADGNTLGGGAILQVDPSAGAQTIISSDGFFQHPTGLTIGPGGELLVTDEDAFRG